MALRIVDAVSDEKPIAVQVEPDPGRVTIPVTDRAQRAVQVQPDPKVFERGQADWTGYAYVIPRSPEQLPPPTPGLCRDRRAWAYRLGGAEANYSRVQVTIQGLASSCVSCEARDRGNRPSPASFLVTTFNFSKSARGPPAAGSSRT